MALVNIPWEICYEPTPGASGLLNTSSDGQERSWHVPVRWERASASAEKLCNAVSHVPDSSGERQSHKTWVQAKLVLLKDSVWPSRTTIPGRQHVLLKQCYLSQSMISTQNTK